MDPTDLKPEHGAFTAIGLAVGGVLARVMKRKPEGESAEVKRLREQLLEARFDKLRSELVSLIAALGVRVDGLQHENGSQGERLAIAEKDINNLWRKFRDEENPK